MPKKITKKPKVSVRQSQKNKQSQRITINLAPPETKPKRAYKPRVPKAEKQKASTGPTILLSQSPQLPPPTPNVENREAQPAAQPSPEFVNRNQEGYRLGERPASLPLFSRPRQLIPIQELSQSFSELSEEQYPETVNLPYSQQPVQGFPIMEFNPPSLAPPPLLSSIPLDPVLIKQKAGPYFPSDRSVSSAAPSFSGETFSEPLRNFEQTQSRNDLLKKDMDLQKLGEDTQDAIRNSYNLSLNTPPQEFDAARIVLPGKEVPSKPKSEPIKRGPKKELTDAEIKNLEEYVRIGNIPVNKRTVDERATRERVKTFITGRRAYPEEINMYLEYYQDQINQSKPSKKKG